MKRLLITLGILAAAAAGVAAIVVVILRMWEREQPLPVATQDSYRVPEGLAFDESELGGPVSEELLSILVCPEDRGPLQLSADGKWLVNPRNGYRYPIRRGIPVMLIEEGRKNRDLSLIQQAAA